MILPVYISGRRVHFLLVQDEPFEVLSTFGYKFPFVEDYSNSFITKKKLIQAISSITNLKKLNSDDLLIISDTKQVNNIDINFQIDEVILDIPYLFCVLGLYSQSSLSALSKEEINHFMTKIYLGDDIDDEIRLKVDTSKIKNFFKENSNKLKTVHKVVVCNDFASEKYKKKIKDIFLSEFASNVVTPCSFGITFDYDYKEILKFGFLKSKRTDIKKYLNSSHEIPETKVLFAPGALEAEFSIIDIKSKTRLEDREIKINPDFANTLEIPQESYVKLALTGNKMHFACELYTGQNEIIIYSKGDLS